MTSHTANRLALKQRNRQYEKQIEEILSRVVGDGKVVAKVSVNMDFTQSVSTSTNFTSENAVFYQKSKINKLLMVVNYHHKVYQSKK